jgi:tetratricopeptide (TPR) repeat protein
VVYDTLLERKKKELHLDIGKAIEEVHKENLEEMYSSLAEHFEQGGDYEKAANYFNWAADREQQMSPFKEAIAFSRKMVACLEKLPSTVEMQKRVIDARIALAYNCTSLNYYVEARDTVSVVFDLAHQLDYRRSLPAIYVFMTAYLIVVEERPKDDEVRRYLMEARRLALEEKDYLSLGNTYFYEAAANASNCEFTEGESCFLRLIERAEAAGNVRGKAVIKFNLASHIYGQSGRIDDALRTAQEALHLGFQAEDLHLKCGAYMAWGMAFLRKGLFPETEESLMLSIEMSQKTDFTGALLVGFLYLGLLRYEMGQYREAQECYDGVLVVYERVRLWHSLARLSQILRVAAGVRGGLNPALDGLLNFDLQEIRLRNVQGSAAQAMGEIYLYIDDKHMDEAETWIRKAIEINEQNRMPWDLARDYALYAEFFKKKADPAQAREKLKKAIELMRGCGADGWVKKYEEQLAGL